MKLYCPSANPEHKLFRRESCDVHGSKLNEEIVDEFGRFVGDPLDLYTGDVTYRFFCVECNKEAVIIEA